MGAGQKKNNGDENDHFLPSNYSATSKKTAGGKIKKRHKRFFFGKIVFEFHVRIMMTLLGFLWESIC